MEANQYQVQAFETADPDLTYTESLILTALGLSGEAGEVTDYIKKVIFHSYTLDDIKLKKELGDVLWYIAYIASVRGYTLSEIMQINLDKLKARYPNGFDPMHSINRKEGDV